MYHHRDGIGRHKGAANVTHDHGHGVVAQRKQGIADEHGNAHAQVFAQKRPAARAKVVQPVGDAPVAKEEIPADEEKFKSAGDERAQRRAGNFHARRAEAAKDEHPIEKYVDEKGKDGGNQRNLYLPHAAQHDGAGERKPHAQIGGDEPAQVNRAVFDDFRILGVDPEDTRGR